MTYLTICINGRRLNDDDAAAVRPLLEENRLAAERVRELECVIADLKAECKGLQAATQQTTPVSWPCEVIEADFGDNTVTLQMKGGNFSVSAGVYQLSPPTRPENKG